MKVLLDTAPFLWLVLDSPRLSAAAREQFANPDNQIFLSSVSAWEIAVKNALGKLPLPESPASLVPSLRQAHGVEPLVLDEEAALHVGRLPPLHRDPFDRLLICQAIVGGMTLLTPDEEIYRYAVRTLW